jgi:hypothetical protein
MRPAVNRRLATLAGDALLVDGLEANTARGNTQRHAASTSSECTGLDLQVEEREVRRWRIDHKK